MRNGKRVRYTLELADPTPIRQELDRRLAAARASDPTKKREQSLQRDLVHVGKGIERLLSAYKEALMSIEQLRERMPGLRQREQVLRAELQAIADQANDRAVFLRLAENLTAFLTRLRSAADTLSIAERQKIVRRRFPRSSVPSTGAFSHILIRCSIAPSTILRATDTISSACGMLSKEAATHYPSSAPSRESYSYPRSASV